MPATPVDRQPAAFTLVELVITLSIAALLVVLALPSYARYIAEQQLLDEARRLSEAVTWARSEAIRRNGHVVLCNRPAGRACGPGGGWHEGWLMFVDENGDAEVDADEIVLMNEGTAPPGITATGNRPVATYLRFDWLGQARLVNGALQMGTVSICKSGLRGYDVVLANTGRTRIDRRAGTCP